MCWRKGRSQECWKGAGKDDLTAVISQLLSRKQMGGKKRAMMLFGLFWGFFCYLFFGGSWAALCMSRWRLCVCTQLLQLFAASGPCVCFNMESPSPDSHKMPTSIWKQSNTNIHYYTLPILAVKPVTIYVLAAEHNSFLSQVKPHVSSYGDCVWSSYSQVTLIPLHHNPSVFLPCWFWALALLWLAKTDCKA